MLFLVTILFIVVAVDWARFQNTLSRLFALENETEHNAEIARAKRDAVLGQLLQIAREYARLEERILTRIQSYPEAIAVLGSLPSRFPNIAASSHYLALMSEVSREQNAMQAKVEAHNAAVREYNSFINSLRGQVYTLNSLPDRTYLGDEWVGTLSAGSRKFLIGR